MIVARKLNPHDVGLPAPAIRKRRRSRRLSLMMLTIAVVTAAMGWPLYGATMLDALRMRDQPVTHVVVAYVLLIASSFTLVLGLWYALLAQMERLARIVDAAELEAPLTQITCPKCQEASDSSDRFCRHCGTALHREKA
jgi:hypothetical protein